VEPEFVATTSLRTPLNAVLGYTDLLRDHQGTTFRIHLPLAAGTHDRRPPAPE